MDPNEMYSLIKGPDTKQLVINNGENVIERDVWW